MGTKGLNWNNFSILVNKLMFLILTEIVNRAFESFLWGKFPREQKALYSLALIQNLLLRSFLRWMDTVFRRYFASKFCSVRPQPAILQGFPSIFKFGGGKSIFSTLFPLKFIVVFVLTRQKSHFTELSLFQGCFLKFASNSLVYMVFADHWASEYCSGADKFCWYQKFDCVFNLRICLWWQQ